MDINFAARLIAGLVLGAGLAIADGEDPGSGIAEVEARFTALIPEVDGRLDELVWSQARTYPLVFSRDREGAPREGGEVQFAWNRHGLYVAARLRDSDVLAHSKEDEDKHYLLGDVFELFVKPASDSYYWELFATPRERKTTIFWFKSAKGTVFSDPMTGHSFRSLKVGSQVQGTLNQSSDSDEGWTVELWVPASYLTHFGEAWGPEGSWRIFCGRYNYGKGFEQPELSMHPPLSATRYHLTGEYAELNLME